MSTITPPPVGTTMKYGALRSEVLLSSPEHMLAQLSPGGWLCALRHADGVWCDNDGRVWWVEEPEPPTLAVGTVLKCGPATRTVVVAAPGFVLVLDEFGRRSTMAWIDNGWRRASDTAAWEVQP
jgi:hypothetical protein